MPDFLHGPALAVAYFRGGVCELWVNSKYKNNVYNENDYKKL